jgi:hypothetical protein
VIVISPSILALIWMKRAEAFEAALYASYSTAETEKVANLCRLERDDWHCIALAYEIRKRLTRWFRVMTWGRIVWMCPRMENICGCGYWRRCRWFQETKERGCWLWLWWLLRVLGLLKALQGRKDWGAFCALIAGSSGQPCRSKRLRVFRKWRTIPAPR